MVHALRACVALRCCPLASHRLGCLTGFGCCCSLGAMRLCCVAARPHLVLQGGVVLLALPLVALPPHGFGSQAVRTTFANVFAILGGGSCM